MENDKEVERLALGFKVEVWRRTVGKMRKKTQKNRHWNPRTVLSVKTVKYTVYNGSTVEEEREIWLTEVERLRLLV